MFGELAGLDSQPVSLDLTSYSSLHDFPSVAERHSPCYRFCYGGCKQATLSRLPATGIIWRFHPIARAFPNSQSRKEARGMPRIIRFRSLAIQSVILSCLLIAYHLLLKLLMTKYGLKLGAVSFKLAPLYAFWHPHLTGWLVAPLLTLGLLLSWLRRTRIASSIRDARAAAALTAWFICFAATVAMIDGGPRAITSPLLRTDLEYYGAIDRVHGVAQFLREFPLQAPSMPMHAQVHPPGAVLFVWAACRLLGGGPWAAASGMILFSAAVVPLVYRWAYRVGGPGAARRAAAVSILTPSLVLFTATSMDGPFAVLLIATMALFWESLEHRPMLLGSLAGVAATAASLMTYSITVALLFCGVAVCVRLADRTAAPRTVVTAALCAAAAFIAANVCLWLVTGYNPVEMFAAAEIDSRRGCHRRLNVRLQCPGGTAARERIALLELR